MTERELKRLEESYCVKQLARALGGTPESESGAWPDGWVRLPSGERIPVEVVDAYQRADGEDPKKGAAWVPEYKKARREARRRQTQTGYSWAWGVQSGRGFIIPLDGTTPPPLALRPVHPAKWVITAVRQKVAKNYAGCAHTLLAVRQVNRDALHEDDLQRVSLELSEMKSPFRGVWVLSDFGLPPQRAA